VARRKESQQATETLEEIEGVLDRMAEWASSNPIIVLGVLGGVLAIAAALGGWHSYQQSRELNASAEISGLLGEYRLAMGAERDAIEVTEPANPETARAARERFAGLLETAAAEHGGTAAAVEARIHAGNLLEKLDDREAALEQWRLAADEASSSGNLEGLALVRLAHGLEAAGEPAEAAVIFERAGDVEDFGDRRAALADAARCYLDAGDSDRALALALRLEGEDEESAASLPSHVEARLSELRLQNAAPATAPVPEAAPEPASDSGADPEPEAPQAAAVEPEAGE
jgi:tetratricopeptide (TPR) repeat protein